MNLEELKNLVAEEYNKYMAEQEDDKEKKDNAKGDDEGKPKKATAPKVKAGSKDLDISGDDDPEKALRDIYNMLKDFFEVDDKGDKKDGEMGDAEKGAPDAPKPSPGMDAPKPPMEMDMLQERFKKLANIIK
tara:strand:+ start:71 stop:466 length:396 start_codon:yes stop_codon:yes gene_type:complete